LISGHNASHNGNLLTCFFLNIEQQWGWSEDWGSVLPHWQNFRVIFRSPCSFFVISDVIWLNLVLGGFVRSA